MTQISQPWDDTALGDATRAPYDAGEWIQMYRSMLRGLGDAGVIPGWYEDLSPTIPANIVGNPITFERGAAILVGLWYESDASPQNMILGAPATNPRIDVLTVSANFSINPITQTGAGNLLFDVADVNSLPAHEARLIRIEGTEGGAPAAPAYDQNPAGLYQVPLYQYQVAVGGATSNLANLRKYIKATDPLFFRQGGSPTNWAASGNNNYGVPEACDIQCGVKLWVGGAAANGTVLITLPRTMQSTPLVIAMTLGSSPTVVTLSAPGNPSFTLRWEDTSAATHTSLEIAWVAIGPRRGY